MTRAHCYKYAHHISHSFAVCVASVVGLFINSNRSAFRGRTRYLVELNLAYDYYTKLETRPVTYYYIRQFVRFILRSAVEFGAARHRTVLHPETRPSALSTSTNMHEPVIVEVKQGKLSGKLLNDYYGGKYYSFSGIPYAKAPVGELRFQPPQPPEPWTGVRDATKEGPECPSLDMYANYYIGSEENCLNLNVYTTQLPSETTVKKAVMVWIHGGGFMWCCNKSEHFGAGYLMTQDIVLVTINYRLGVFGFLCLEDPALGVPGNNGMKDQVQALRWVQENIENFNGDKTNVTIFGESAGSASVHYLTLSPLTKGLFHKAIAQSGCALNDWARGAKNALYMAEYLGYKEKDEPSIFERLKKESAKKLTYAGCKVPDPFWPSVVRPFCPVIEPPSDGAFLTEEPEAIIKSGKHQQIPMIMGHCSREGLLYELARRTKSYAEVSGLDLQFAIPYSFNLAKESEEAKRIADKINEFYYKGRGVTEETINETYKFFHDSQFVYKIQKAIRLHKSNGNQTIYYYRNNLSGPLNYFSRFSSVYFLKTVILCNFMAKLASGTRFRNLFVSLSSSFSAKEITGATHADDLFYLFPTFFSPKIPKGSDADECIQTFVKLWTNFAKSGNPESEKVDKEGKVVWEPVGENIDSIFEINKELSVTENVEAEGFNFWDGIYKEFSAEV